jgi:hypothetical protein
MGSCMNRRVNRFAAGAKDLTLLVVVGPAGYRAGSIGIVKM